MAINKTDMAQEIIDAMAAVPFDPDNQPSPQDYMTEFGTAMKTYLENNLEVSYSWTATTPPPASVPDPVTSFDASVTFPTFTLTSPADISLFGPMIQLQLAGAIITPDDPTFILPPGTFLPVAPIVVTQSGKDNTKDAIEFLCDQVIISLKTWINPTPIPGTHLTFVTPTPGAIMTSIS